MEIEEALSARLQQLAGLVGVPVFSGIRPQQAGRQACLVFNIEDQDFPTDLDGQATTGEATATITAVSTDLAEAEALADMVRTSLPTTGASWSGLQVDGCLIDQADHDPPMPLPDGSDSGMYEITNSFLILYQAGG